MNKKVVTNALRESIESSLERLSVAISQQTNNPQLFALQEQDALTVKTEEGEVSAYGILIEYAIPNTPPTILYRRAYSTENQSLNTVRLHAFQELMDSLVGNFALIALGQHRMVEASKKEEEAEINVQQEND